MKTKELIKKLQEIDPDGNMEIWLDGCYYGYPIENVEIHEAHNVHTGEPWYWLEIC